MFKDPFPDTKYKDLVAVICSNCGTEVSRKKKDVIKTLKEGHNIVCSRECTKVDLNKTCLECGKDFLAKDNRQKYCNRSCAASYNNRVSPKRNPKNSSVCPDCGKKKNPVALTCHNCKLVRKLKEVSSQPISRYFRDYAKHNAKWNEVRTWARNSMKVWGVEKKCAECGFDYYVEVCHIVPVTEFSMDSLMGEVNSRENLIYLCPNHHIMLDKGVLDLSHIS